MASNVLKFPKKPDVAILKAFDAFGDMREEQIKNILQLAQKHRFHQDEIIFDEGEAAKRFYLVMSGYVRFLHISDLVGEVIVFVGAEGSICGMSKPFGTGNYLVRAMASTEVEMLSWPTNLWDHFMEDYPGFSDAVTKMLGLRMALMNEHLAEISNLPLERRLGVILVRMVKQVGEYSDFDNSIRLSFTKGDLCEMAAVEPAQLKVLTRKWEQNGVLRILEHEIVVKDMGFLQKLVQG